VHAPLEHAEADQGRTETHAEDQVDRDRRLDRHEHLQHEQRNAGEHRQHEGQTQRVGAVGAGDLVLHQRSHRLRLEPEAAGGERAQDHQRQKRPSAEMHQRHGTRVERAAEERRLLRQEYDRKRYHHPRAAPAQLVGGFDRIGHSKDSRVTSGLHVTCGLHRSQAFD
jgi:hypothetical protein